jgi:predicted phosphodiesterase
MCYQRVMHDTATPGMSEAPKRGSGQLVAAWWSRAIPWLAVVLAGLFGAWAGVAIAGTTNTHLGPLAVDAEISPSWTGETVLRVDPIGELIFDTHTAPVRVTVDVRSVDPQAFEQIVANPAALNALEGQLINDLDTALRQAALRTALAAVIGAIVIGGLALRSVRRALLAGAVALAAVGLSYGLTLMTFDRSAAQEPQYSGLISAAPRLIGTVEAITADFGDYTDQLATLVTNVSRLYDAAISLPTFAPTEDMIRVLHVADLHLNPAAWGVIRAVSEQYQVDVIVDSGDIADHGTAAESRYVEPIGGLGVPYIYVKGNHDSILTQAAIAEQPNAIVLDYEPVTVAGLQFLGAPDPRFTPDQRTRGTADQDLRDATARLAETAREMRMRPDVIVVHDPTNAELFQDTAPLVLAGHSHRRNNVYLEDGTHIFIQGTTGGAGLRGLQHEEPMPVALSVLYFDVETKRLAAWDDITLGGIGLSSAEVQRHQVGDPDETVVEPGEEAAETPSDDVSPTPTD